MSKKISTFVGLALVIVTGLSIFNVISKDQEKELSAWIPTLGTTIGSLIALFTDGKPSFKNLW